MFSNSRVFQYLFILRALVFFLLRYYLHRFIRVSMSWAAFNHFLHTPVALIPNPYTDEAEPCSPQNVQEKCINKVFQLGPSSRGGFPKKVLFVFNCALRLCSTLNLTE